MFNSGCAADGSLNDSKFNDPMPWIGIYVAAASIICGIAMALDALNGFRYKRFWFPCRFFTLNATTLTVIAVAIKFSVDLNAAMPRRQDQLAKKLKQANKVCFNQRNLPVAERLKQDLGKYWMMAYTSSPQFVIGRSAPCSASGAFCLFNMLILGEAILRTRLMPWSMRFCNGDSDYMWSTTLVLFSQTVAVGLGTISPAFRWFMTINFRCPTKARRACGQEFVVERYWIKRMLLWQVQPLEIRICNRWCRKNAHGAKFQIFRLVIGTQKGLVCCCKMIRFVSIFLVSRFLRLKNSISGDNSLHSNDSDNTALSDYVIYLDGEEGLVDLMMENNCNATAQWIKMGENKQPRNLIKLLEDSNLLSSFSGVREFDSDKVPSLCSREPPNCWALPIVTLTTITVSLPNIDKESIQLLVSGVDEGLKYVREIEKYMDEKNDLTHVRKAAEVIWSGVELYNKWLYVDLSKLAHPQPQTGTEIIKLLAKISKEKFIEFSNKDMMRLNECLMEVPSRWPRRVLAANSMYRICETLLLTTSHETSERLFEKLSLIICNILCAALTNLQHVISKKCHESRIEEREKNIRSAVLLFAKTRKILEVLDRKLPEDSDHGKFIQIDKWHLSKKMDSLYSMSSSTDEEIAGSSPSDFYADVFLAPQVHGSIQRFNLDMCDCITRLLVIEPVEDFASRLALNMGEDLAYMRTCPKIQVECFNCHKMGHFARECRAPRSQDRGKRDNFRQGSKVEEQASKALMEIDGVEWD
nr:transmembrane protein [Tanacetum cinerariifolium]